MRSSMQIVAATCFLLLSVSVASATSQDCRTGVHSFAQHYAHYEWGIEVGDKSPSIFNQAALSTIRMLTQLPELCQKQLQVVCRAAETLLVDGYERYVFSFEYFQFEALPTAISEMRRLVDRLHQEVVRCTDTPTEPGAPAGRVAT